MPILALITFFLVSPFMAISLLPAMRQKEDENEDQPIVRWKK